jgi:hypothetical protein
MKPQPATLRSFPETPEGIAAYYACLQAGGGFIANCTGGYPKGYMFHRASCSFLDLHKDRNPIRGATGKIWAKEIKEGKAPSRKLYGKMVPMPSERTAGRIRHRHGA